jgi:hypothetical protein
LNTRPGPCPGGILENSPAFQRWVCTAARISPEGTAEVSALNRPFGTWRALLAVPALKRWAIPTHPSGMKSSKPAGINAMFCATSSVTNRLHSFAALPSPNQLAHTSTYSYANCPFVPELRRIAGGPELHSTTTCSRSGRSVTLRPRPFSRPILCSFTEWHITPGTARQAPGRVGAPAESMVPKAGGEAG